RSLAHAAARTESTPRGLLVELNKLLTPDLKRGFFVSAACASIDPRTGEATLASAGSRAPMLQFVSAAAGIRAVQPDGIALGLDKGPVFERSLQEAHLTLAPGDALVLATEGAFQLLGSDGKPLGDVSFRKLALAEAKSGLDGLAGRIVAAVEARLAPDPGAFDMTVVTAVRVAG
ncbi:MAG TPA: PP2C family protein-serine/threonine phosphatase, partial [Planctomycetota bacterium]|nr:PP2C family protein-serine/threonine phosphatase [Planctomycetota bacterium]